MADDVYGAAGGLLGKELRKVDEQASRERMSDQALIINAPGPGDPRHEMEIQRRLKDSVESLTAEIVTLRKSSDSLIGNLTNEIVAFRTASDNAAERLETLTIALKRFTVILVVLTAVLVVLTVIVMCIT